MNDQFSGAGGFLNGLWGKAKILVKENQVIVLLLVEPLFSKYVPIVSGYLFEIILRFSIWLVL